MSRRIVAVLAGVLVWLLVATIVNRLLRMGLAGYAAAEPAMAFTLTMQWWRLAMGALSSVVAGYATARLAGAQQAGGAPRASAAATILAVVLLVFFLPVHYTLWTKFPAWYHLLFLASLPALTMLGARLARGTPRDATQR